MVSMKRCPACKSLLQTNLSRRQRLQVSFPFKASTILPVPGSIKDLQHAAGAPSSPSSSPPADNRADFKGSNARVNPDKEGSAATKVQRNVLDHLNTADGRTSQSLLGKVADKFAASGTKTSQEYLVYGRMQTLVWQFGARANYTIPESQRRDVLTGKQPPQTADGEDLGVPSRFHTPKAERNATLSAVPDRPSKLLIGSSQDINTNLQSWWFNELGLPPTFSTWSQVTLLLMYLYLVRLRAVSTPPPLPDPLTPSSSSPSSASQPSSKRANNTKVDPEEYRSVISMQQRYLLDHFSHLAEGKMMTSHNIADAGTRGKYLKDLFLQWRGIQAAYDEGLVKGDAVLATAVWRNLFKGASTAVNNGKINPSSGTVNDDKTVTNNIDWTNISTVVAFMRKSIKILSQLSDAQIWAGSLMVRTRAAGEVEEEEKKEEVKVQEGWKREDQQDDYIRDEIEPDEFIIRNVFDLAKDGLGKQRRKSLI